MDSIKLENLKLYLRNKSWIFSEFDPISESSEKVSLQFENESIEILLPKKDTFVDYKYRIDDIIEVLVDIYQKPREVIINEINSLGYDRLTFHFESETIKGNSIPLPDASIIIPEIKNILQFTACSEIVEKSRYTTVYDQAKVLVNGCRFAQTEVGSFVFNFEIPIELNPEDTTDEEDEIEIEDLGRKTLSRLIKAINIIPTLNIDNEAEFNEKYKNIISRNVIDSLNKIVQSESGYNFDLKVKYNSIKNPKEHLPESAIIKANIFYPKCKKIYDLLENTIEDKEETIIGKVQDTKRQKLGDPFVGQIIVKDISSRRNIYMIVNEENYSKACDANRDQSKIRITGIVSRGTFGKRHWFLTNPTEFKSENE